MVVPYSSSNMAGVNFAEVYVAPAVGAYNYGTSNPAFEVGTIADGRDGSKWIYIKVGVGGITGLGYVVVYDEDFLGVMMSNTVGGFGDKVGVAGINSAALVDNYCWLQVYGTCDNIRCFTSDAANVPQASTTNAGEIDDAVANPTKNLPGIVLTTARAASPGLAPGELNWPVVGTTN